MADRRSITDALMQTFLPRSYRAMGGELPYEAPSMFTPPLWRDPDNPLDPMNRRPSMIEGETMPEDPRIRAYRR